MKDQIGSIFDIFLVFSLEFIFLQFSKNMRKAIAVEIKDSTKENVSLLSIVYKQKLYIWLNVLVLSMERGWEGWTK